MHKVLVLALCCFVSACATKRYDRLQPVSDTEKRFYSCRDIEIELSKVDEARRQLVEGSEINAASVAGFLGDFGIGNAMEKNEAEKSILQRELALKELRANKECH